MKFKLLLFFALNLTAFASPLQDAINAADPGDILRLNDGLYEAKAGAPGYEATANQA